jgi:hypothetical protein
MVVVLESPVNMLMNAAETGYRVQPVMQCVEVMSKAPADRSDDEERRCEDRYDEGNQSYARPPVAKR